METLSDDWKTWVRLNAEIIGKSEKAVKVFRLAQKVTGWYDL
jgi:ABC-type Fe3+-hydroxamate transport system substrate-binding protein